MWLFTPAICPVDAYFCRPLASIRSSNLPQELGLNSHSGLSSAALASTQRPFGGTLAVVAGDY